MVERGTGGAIVNLASQAGQAALMDHLIYGASKAAVDQLTRNFALELGPKNVSSTPLFYFRPIKTECDPGIYSKLYIMKCNTQLEFTR